MAGRRRVGGVSEPVSARVEAWVAVRTDEEESSRISLGVVAKVRRVRRSVEEERRRAEWTTRPFFTAKACTDILWPAQGQCTTKRSYRCDCI